MFMHANILNKYCTGMDFRDIKDSQWTIIKATNTLPTCTHYDIHVYATSTAIVNVINYLGIIPTRWLSVTQHFYGVICLILRLQSSEHCLWTIWNFENTKFWVYKYFLAYRIQLNIKVPGTTQYFIFQISLFSTLADIFAYFNRDPSHALYN